MASGGLKTVQRGPETLPGGLQEGSKRQISLVFQLFLEVFRVLTFSSPERPKSAQGFQTPSQYSPRGPLKGPKTVQEGPKTAPEEPKTAPEGPKTVQEGPKRAP